MRSGALPVPDLPSPPHPRYPNLTGAQTANLATRYPTHRKQRGGFISHILFGSSLLRFLCPEHRASLLAPDTFRSSRSSAPVREFHGHEAGDRDGDEELPDNGLQIR